MAGPDQVVFVGWIMSSPLIIPCMEEGSKKRHGTGFGARISLTLSNLPVRATHPVLWLQPVIPSQEKSSYGIWRPPEKKNDVEVTVISHMHNQMRSVPRPQLRHSSAV